MSQAAIDRPQANEYNEYYSRYISLVPQQDILLTLERQLPETVKLLRNVGEDRGGYRYAPDKWSIKQVIGHLADTERVFAYRALRISRNDSTPIEGFEQDDYVLYGPFQQCRLADLVSEFEHIRHSTLDLFRNLDPQAWTRRGVANKNEVSVRAIAYILAGHELHHRKILQEKYLAASAA
ncbi:MAG TPA: DinB family protein [Terriglobales bacterium]|nr:DinB family protein [Terriglobales bacterium]